MMSLALCPGTVGCFEGQGRVRSRVRPVSAAGMAAGPNALRGSGPKTKARTLEEVR